MKKHINHQKRGHVKKEWNDCPSDWDKRMEEKKYKNARDDKNEN